MDQWYMYYRYVDLNLEKYSQKWELASVWWMYSFIKYIIVYINVSSVHVQLSRSQFKIDHQTCSWPPTTCLGSHDCQDQIKILMRNVVSIHLHTYPPGNIAPEHFLLAPALFFSGELLGSVTMTENPMFTVGSKNHESPESLTWLDTILPGIPGRYRSVIILAIETRHY